VPGFDNTLFSDRIAVVVDGHKSKQKAGDEQSRTSK